MSIVLSDLASLLLRVELRLGDILGQGEFGTVREVREVSLSQRQLLRKDSSKLNLFDERYTEKDNVSGLSKMDRDRLTVRQLSFREGRARYAVKRVREDLVGKDRILSSLDLAVEARFLASLTHPNIVRMRGAAGQPGGPLFMIIMDRLYGTLEEKLEMWRGEAREAAGAGCSAFGSGAKFVREWNDVFDQVIVAYDVSRALNFLHEHKYVAGSRCIVSLSIQSLSNSFVVGRIIYRDLKPTNVGFDVRGHVKLFDLGLAKELKEHDRVHEDRYDLTPMTGTRVRLTGGIVAREEL
jgi:serine/threonine protein kinase